MKFTVKEMYAELNNLQRTLIIDVCWDVYGAHRQIDRDVVEMLVPHQLKLRDI